MTEEAYSQAIEDMLVDYRYLEAMIIQARRIKI